MCRYEAYLPILIFGQVLAEKLVWALKGMSPHNPTKKLAHTF